MHMHMHRPNRMYVCTHYLRLILHVHLDMTCTVAEQLEPLCHSNFCSFKNRSIIAAATVSVPYHE